MAIKKEKIKLTIPRQFTIAGENPFDKFQYEMRSSVIRNPAGDSVFEMKNVEVPVGWSQVATDILAQKYFRKAGVPDGKGGTTYETSVKQVVHRLALCWKIWGEKYGYFSEEDANVFYDELVYMLLDQRAAPNSPQWFNTGLFEAYGITGPAQGHYYVDEGTGETRESTSAYERAQAHACFILSVQDNLVNEGGIMDLFVREARIFKYGSGVGTNYSNIRADNEPLSGGGNSSGLMSFLKVGDRAAGAIKSGGTTRRAAKMVILDIDHPEIHDFINWKAEEEKKVAALISAGYSSDYEGEAYRTVSGQNSNNSVRINQQFLDALEANDDWHCTARTNGKIMKTYKAKDLWENIAKASWNCADPGLQFHTTINDWHTCPADGEIRASNPCSEYMFLDDTACNLASINLRKFFNENTLEFDIDDLKHAARLWTIVLEISVLMAHYPSKKIAELSYKYRTLGLGYANLGSVLMVAGIPYDSPKATAIAGAITSLVTGTAYATSAEMAMIQKKPFAGYGANRDSMLRVIRNHRYAAYNSVENFEGLSVKPTCIDPNYCPPNLLKEATAVWDVALKLGEEYGYRNAQVTVLAPTGTIGLLMDCDTTGVEPDFALVKFKKLSGGGYFKIINQSIPPALKNLGYTPEQITDIVNYVKGAGNINNAPNINESTLQAKGFNSTDLSKINQQLHSAFDITFVFNMYTLGEETMRRIGFTPEQYTASDFNLLKELGFTQKQIDSANEYVCGTMTVEGAPHLKSEHYAVFDCANKCGIKGTRFIHPHGHLRMMASAQAFISGAISKTINLPNEATWKDIEECHELAWKYGLKAISIYRDGSKLSQPLSSKQDKKPANDVKTLSTHQLLELVQLTVNSTDDNEFKTRLRQMVNRKQLPSRRKGFTQKAKVGGQTIFLRTGEYEDGKLGEIFIDMHKEGATLRSMLNCFAIAVSIGLQYGVPLDEFVDKFAFTRFEPSGMVDHENIKSATSIVDYIFRLLALEYLDRDDLVQIPRSLPQPEESDVKHPLQAHTDTQITVTIPTTINGTNSQQKQLSTMMGDAPACTICGHITVRNGTCYKCLNCGNSMGCS